MTDHERAKRLIIELLEDGPRSLAEICDASRLGPWGSRAIVSELVEDGYVTEDSGTYELCEDVASNRGPSWRDWDEKPVNAGRLERECCPNPRKRGEV